ncbi:MAG: cupin domain-containing protein [Christensenella sp.]|nr:cupin domain-containing protein [Christensenella sp.]
MVINKTTAEHYTWGEVCDGWRLADQQDLAVIQEHMPPKTKETRHVHAYARQFFYILEGEALMELNGENHRLRTHEGIEIPPNTPHTMMNPFESPVEFLVISSPATKGDRTNID